MTLPCVCLDVGSGWVKALGIDAAGEPIGAATHLTTPADLLGGVRAAAAAAQAVGVDRIVPSGRSGWDIPLLACSSAGGGLRLAVVGRERLAATEAGHRVACSAGARVVHVEAGELDPAGIRALRAGRPDVVLLLGGSGSGGSAGGAGDGSGGRGSGSDGGGSAIRRPRTGGSAGRGGSGSGAEADRVLLANSARLARARFRAPIVLAAAEPVRADAAAVLASTGRTVVPADAVLTEPGVIVVEPAREAIVGLLGKHLVGGRGSATTARFRRLARTATPSAVRAGLAELVRLRAGEGGSLLVIDVGSSTTDVHSVRPDGGWTTTVEADLGMRLTAPGILTEGQAQAVVDPMEADLLLPTVRRLAEETDFLPEDSGAQAEDRRLAALSAVLAARRHVRVAGAELRRAGVGLVVLTGGVFRQPDSAGLGAVRDTLRADADLRDLLAGTPVAVDDGFALAPAGLLAAAGHPESARTVLDTAIAPYG
jgi:hypothetical protein